MGVEGANLTIYQSKSGEFYTNHQHLPAEVVAAVMMDRYTDETEEAWDYSSSNITTPIQLQVLKKRYGSKDIKKHKLRIFDVTDKFASFYGSVAHQVLEDAWHESMGSISEERIYMTVHGKIISGKLDIYHEPEVRDYKSTQVYKIANKLFGEWDKGQNVYAALCRINGRIVEKLTVVALMKDWKKGELYKENYPPAPMQMLSLNVWPQEQAMGYINERVLHMIEAEGIEDGVREELTANRPDDMGDDDFEASVAHAADRKLFRKFPCTNEEMWQRFQDFAVMKDGGARANKTCDTREEAEKYIEEKGWGPEYKVEERWTKRTRCLDWCECSTICIQHKILNGEDPDAPAPLF